MDLCPCQSSQGLIKKQLNNELSKQIFYVIFADLRISILIGDVIWKKLSDSEWLSDDLWYCAFLWYKLWLFVAEWFTGVINNS